MIFDTNTPLAEIPDICYTLLKRGSRDRKHQFRYFTLATSGSLSSIRQRTVVLRKADSSLHALFLFTDARSIKVAQFYENPYYSALFYDSRHQVQITVRGDARLHIGDDLANSMRESVPEEARKAYTTALPPGAEVAGKEIEYRPESFNDNFCVVRLNINEMEVLQLNRDGDHLRYALKRTQNDWHVLHLVP